jgi:hypothetical protein
MDTTWLNILGHDLYSTSFCLIVQRFYSVCFRKIGKKILCRSGNQVIRHFFSFGDSPNTIVSNAFFCSPILTYPLLLSLPALNKHIITISLTGCKTPLGNL